MRVFVAVLVKRLLIFGVLGPPIGGLCFGIFCIALIVGKLLATQEWDGRAANEAFFFSAMFALFSYSVGVVPAVLVGIVDSIFTLANVSLRQRLFLWACGGLALAYACGRGSMFSLVGPLGMVSAVICCRLASIAPPWSRPCASRAV